MPSNTKTNWKVVIATMLLAVGICQADTFDLTWNTLADGGGTSTGAGFELNGTIGQADAGELSGGVFEMTGGFWAASTTSGAFCPGDLNSDSRVDLADLVILLSNYGSTNATLEEGDITGDGNVDLGDLAAMMQHYGDVCS